MSECITQAGCDKMQRKGGPFVIVHVMDNKLGCKKDWWTFLYSRFICTAMAKHKQEEDQKCLEEIGGDQTLGNYLQKGG